jgi:putative flippase GtrA
MRELTRFWRFSAIGGLGFAVDGGVLTLLVNGLGFGPYGARLFSFAGAVTVTWLLNRSITFADGQSASRGREYARYVGVQLVGGASNLAVYAACLAMWQFLARWPIIALAFGALIGLCVNFTLSRFLVFTPSTR